MLSWQLMHCQVCCVPYHWYCLKDYCREDDRKNFICAACIHCAVCGGRDHVSSPCVCRVNDISPIQLWLCCKCKKYYHSDCLPGQEITPNRSNRLSWQCINCSKCCSCGNTCPADSHTHNPTIVKPDPDICSPTPQAEGNTYQFCSSCYKLFSEGLLVM